jgi:hypothetical protein
MFEAVTRPWQGRFTPADLGFLAVPIGTTSEACASGPSSALPLDFARGIRLVEHLD